jgi:hypothetical protein
MTRGTFGLHIAPFVPRVGVKAALAALVAVVALGLAAAPAIVAIGCALTANAVPGLV